MLETNANIILAAGTQTRWTHEPIEGLPKIKQLVEVEGEILIERIQRQFPGSIVITRNHAISLHCKMVFNPQQNEVTVATLHSTYSLWKDWTTILLGDVNYGENTIEKLETQKEPLMFYGDKGEIYAVKWHKSKSHVILTAINQLINKIGWEQRFGKLWNMYRTINKEDFRIPIIKDFFTFVSDCEDFDNQQQYVKYAKKQGIRK